MGKAQDKSKSTSTPGLISSQPSDDIGAQISSEQQGPMDNASLNDEPGMPDIPSPTTSLSARIGAL